MLPCVNWNYAFFYLASKLSHICQGFHLRPANPIFNFPTATPTTTYFTVQCCSGKAVVKRYYGYQTVVVGETFDFDNVTNPLLLFSALFYFNVRAIHTGACSQILLQLRSFQSYCKNLNNTQGTNSQILIRHYK